MQFAPMVPVTDIIFFYWLTILNSTTYLADKMAKKFIFWVIRTDVTYTIKYSSIRRFIN